MPVSSTHRRILLSCAIALSITTLGCTSFTDKLQTANDTLPWNAAAAKTRKLESTPVRIAAVWTHDIVNVPGSKPVQGFGGRIYFYNHEQKSIQVDGELVVFAFDDTKAEKQKVPTRNPERKFVFRADQLQTHLSDSELGPSYSFWIPWQEFGGEPRLISLVPVFRPLEGRNITGHFSKTSLPGKHKPSPSAQPQDQVTTSQRTNTALHSQPISRENYQGNHNSTVLTTTFDVPQSLTRHLVSSSANRTTPVAAVTPAASPVTTTPNSAPTATGQKPQKLGQSSLPYRSLTSPSGLQAIKILPPGMLRNAANQ
ncbi:hypothetical protein OAO39_00135 [Pirellulaceae bacterium]|nr:hypothetical protein [Pirellulaceae bacterium]